MIYDPSNIGRVTITHKPTGISATSNATRWPSKNKAIAMKLLRNRLHAARLPNTDVIRTYDLTFDTIKDARSGRKFDDATQTLDGYGSVERMIGPTPAPAAKEQA